MIVNWRKKASKCPKNKIEKWRKKSRKWRKKICKVAEGKNLNMDTMYTGMIFSVQTWTRNTVHFMYMQLDWKTQQKKAPVHLQL